ncbi:hypothetical protein Hypma_002025 [Hypsizygus marmoreus]|uniref:Uncharacterized protein n=1 Tax=Hypsizygus marmoreus TaxID=39966 RepID=A0A369J4S5_HYPMA|nr:hypothetical protein Hypma_002025 [Hypsizygus marmoreus]
MTFTQICQHLLQISSYVTSDGFLSLIGWHREGMGNVLITKCSGDKMVCIIVGQVIDEHPYCGSMGNLLEGNTFNKLMESTKFSFMLSRPLDSEFAQDFDQAVRTAKNWEGSIAMTDNRRYSVEAVGHENLLRFMAACWEKRDVPLKPSIDTVDTNTSSWPVPVTRQAAFNATKLTHRILPLTVYDQDRLFIDCSYANTVLRNAIIKVHFTVKHYAIRHDSGFDSFSGIIQ